MIQKIKKKLNREKQRTYYRNYYLLNKEKIIANYQRRYYGFTCVAHGIPDKIKTTKICNEIINKNVIIRLMD